MATAIDTTGRTGDRMAGIRARLARLRRAVRVWIALDAAAALARAVVAWAALSLLVDRTLRMDRAQRGIWLAIGIALMLVVLWRRLVRPLGVGLDDETLCRRVEARHPELAQALISAVEFERGGAEHAAYSPRLVHAAVAEGARRAEGVAFEEVLDRRRRGVNLRWLVGLTAVGLIGALVLPDTLALWARRNLLLGAVAWPRQTHLLVLDTTDDGITLPRGDDLTLLVEAEAGPGRVVPMLVQVDYRSPESDAPSGADRMVKLGANRFRWHLRNVQRPFELRVRGGDDVTEWLPVRLVARPSVETLALRIEPPAYTGAGPERLDATLGALPVLKGSALHIEGAASKPVEAAALHGPADFRLQMDRNGDRAFAATLEGDALRTGEYRIELRDRDGLLSRPARRFALRLVSDRKPGVRVRLRGVGESITPRAVLPMEVQLDDDYGIAEAQLVYRAGEEEGTAETHRRPLQALAAKVGARQVERTVRIDVANLGAAVGGTLSLSVEAADNDAVSGPKVGSSDSFSFRVVTADALRTQLLRREQELRLEFERVHRDQQALLEDTRALLAALRSAREDQMADTHAARVRANERKQRLLRERCRAVASRFEAILTEAQNNRIDPDGTLARRLGEGVVNPLRTTADGPVTRAADALENALRPGIDPLAALDQAEAAQRRAEARMAGILKNMTRWESYEEAVRLLREVLDAQRRVHTRTKEKIEGRIRDIFDE